MEPPEDVRLRSSRGPILLLTVLVLGGVGAGAWVLDRTPHPERVVVGASGCSPACVESLRRRVRHHLAPHGFEVLPEGDDPSSVGLWRSVADLLADARRYEAAHAVFVEVAPTLQREGLAGEGTTAIVAEVRVRSGTRGAVPRESHSVTLAVDVRGDEDRALMRAGMEGVDALGEVVAAELLGGETVTDLLKSDPGPKDLEIFEALGLAHRGLTQRRRGAEDFARACGEARAQIGEEQADLRVQCLTSLDARSDGACPEEYALAVTPDGSGALLRRETGRPVFPVGSAVDVRRVEIPDQLVLAPFEGEAEVVLSTHNLYGDGSLRADGGAAVYIETAGRTSALVWLDIGSRERIPLQREQAPARIDRPVLSPGGLHVAFGFRAYRGAEPQLFVVATDGGEPFEATPHGAFAEWVTLRVEEGAAPETLLAVVVPGDTEPRIASELAGDAEERSNGGEAPALRGTDDLMAPLRREDVALPPLSHIALLRVANGDAELVARIGGTERPVGAIVGARPDAEGLPTSELVLGFSSRNYGCGFARYDAISEALTWVRTSPCVGHAMIADDTRVVAHAGITGEGDPEGSDLEIVSVDIEGGQVVALTRNALTDRDARAVRRADGSVRVVFERQPRRVYRRHSVSAVCFFDLPEPAPSLAP